MMVWRPNTGLGLLNQAEATRAEAPMGWNMGLGGGPRRPYNAPTEAVKEIEYPWNMLLGHRGIF